MFDAYGVQHALVVETNSAYGEDNRCLIDAVAGSGGRFKGVGVVHNDVSRAELGWRRRWSVPASDARGRT